MWRAPGAIEQRKREKKHTNTQNMQRDEKQFICR